MKSFLINFKEGQKLFGETISGIVNLIVLSIVYFLGVGITSIIAKVVGKRFLEKRLDKNAATYWQDLNLNKKPLEDYYRQF